MSKKLITQVVVLNERTYNEAKSDETGFYSKESVATFEDYVNFQLQVFDDQGMEIDSVIPNNEGTRFVIVCKIKE